MGKLKFFGLLVCVAVASLVALDCFADYRVKSPMQVCGPNGCGPMMFEEDTDWRLFLNRPSVSRVSAPVQWMAADPDAGFYSDCSRSAPAAEYSDCDRSVSATADCPPDCECWNRVSSSAVSSGPTFASVNYSQPVAWTASSRPAYAQARTGPVRSILRVRPLRAAARFLFCRCRR